MLTYGQKILTSSPCSRASKIAENDVAMTCALPSSKVCTASVWESKVVTFCSTLMCQPEVASVVAYAVDQRDLRRLWLRTQHDAQRTATGAGHRPIRRSW